MARVNAMVARRQEGRIAIIGAGFSGMAMAAALIEAVDHRLHIVMIEGNAARAGGLAFGRAHAGELLNVRARDLGLLASHPGDFADWLAGFTSGGAPTRDDLAAAGERFAPRAAFSDYLRRRFDELVSRSPHVTVETVREEAIGIARRPGGGFRVDLVSGLGVSVEAVVLATGYGEAQGRFGRSPFAGIEAAELENAGHIAIVGSGLSMVDTLLRLRAMGSRAEITVISRRGLMPQPHAPLSVRPPAWQVTEGVSLRVLYAELRRAVARAEAEGRPWQGEINRLRPFAQDIWRTLSEADRSRFMRHLRRIWDAHRHRLPAGQHARLMAEFDKPETCHRAGRVVAARPGQPARLEVVWRGESVPETLLADIVFDCSGHRPDMEAPLLRGLLREGLAVPDPLGIGLKVAPDGRVWVPDDDLSGLFAIGPLGQGSLFEITGVPEILGQTARAAETLRDLVAMRAAVRTA